MYFKIIVQNVLKNVIDKPVLDLEKQISLFTTNHQWKKVAKLLEYVLTNYNSYYDIWFNHFYNLKLLLDQNYDPNICNHLLDAADIIFRKIESFPLDEQDQYWSLFHFILSMKDYFTVKDFMELKNLVVRHDDSNLDELMANVLKELAEAKKHGLSPMYTEDMEKNIHSWKTLLVKPSSSYFIDSFRKVFVSPKAVSSGKRARL